jgi:YfiH family protein
MARMPEPVRADCLRLDGIAHGFFGRRGGVSKGIYAALNCGLGSGDLAEAVRENRGRVRTRLGARALLTAHQIHSADAATAAQAWADNDRPRADAIVTATPGLAVGVLSADCAPLLFADAAAGVVGAAHAGWRGALGGIVEATLAAMEALGARRARIAAAVGPAIGQAVYEVGPEFRAHFLAADAASARFFIEPAGRRAHFDLAGYLAHRLSEAGVARIESTAMCTFAQDKDFFSFRRAQRQQERDYGRQISAIVLT